MLPEFDHSSHCGHNQQKAKQDWKATPYSHESDGEMIAGCRGDWAVVMLRETLRHEQELGHGSARISADRFPKIKSLDFFNVGVLRWPFLVEFPVAINDFSAIIDCMASITIRQLPETTKRKLRIRAAQHGRSMEQEAREILKSELNRPEDQPKDLAEAIRRRFARFGGVKLEIPPREPIPEPRIR